MNLVVIWQRFGPYHLARLQGASECIESVVGLEVAGADHYAWDAAAHEGGYQRRTLFPDRQYALLTKSEICKAVRRTLDEEGPDAVAINGWAVPEALAALKWCKKNGRKAILMSESFVPSGSWLKEWVKARRVAKFDAALVGGRWHKEYLVSLGFPEDCIEIGYDAVDNAHFQEGAELARSKAAQLRAAHQLPEKYFFANTRFLRRKNIDGLLRAFAMIGRKGGCSLVISGSGEEEENWKELAEELGIADCVVWPGFLQYDELPVYYGLAMGFVHPAYEEAWGLVVNEACAAGLPVIVGSRVGASCELVRDGGNGWLVDSHDDGSLRKALAGLIEAGDEGRRSMGERSRELVSGFGCDGFGMGLSLKFKCKV